MAKEKIHASWVRVGTDEDKEWERVEPRDCPGCRPKCPSCGHPFSVSTAFYEDKVYCSSSCEGSYIPRYR